MVKSALAFLDPEIELLCATMENSQSRGVDIRGSASYKNASGVIAQAIWGFDTHYQCTWEFLGTEGRILCERALTPPPGYEPAIRIERGSDKQDIKLPSDNHYVNQWNFFTSAICTPDAIPVLLDEALAQAQALDKIKKMANGEAIISKR